MSIEILVRQRFINHLPDELKELLLGEKFLIQEYAMIMPIVHIYMGALGIIIRNY